MARAVFRGVVPALLVLALGVLADEGGQENLRRARAAALKKDWKEARLEARAALEAEPAEAGALAVLGEAEERLDNKGASLDATWKLLGLAGKPEIAPLQVAAQARLSRLSPSLAGYLRLKEKAAEELSGLCKKAEQKRRSKDADRMRGTLQLLGRNDGASASGAWMRVSDPKAWMWREKPPKAVVTPEAVKIPVSDAKMMVQQYLDKPPLAKDAGLRFSFQYSGDAPVMFVMMGGSAAKGMDHAVLLDFKSAHRVCFSDYERDAGEDRSKDGGWKIKEGQNAPLPESVISKKGWHRCEIQFVQQTRKIQVSLDDKPALDVVLPGDFPLAGSWGFGYGGPAEYEVKDIEIRKEAASP